MSQYVFGVDIGGTTVKLGLFDGEGNLLEKWEIPTRKENDGSKILPDVAESIEKKIKEKNIERKDVVGVGVGAPGPIDVEGTVHKAANLAFSLAANLRFASLVTPVADVYCSRQPLFPHPQTSVSSSST